MQPKLSQPSQLLGDLPPIPHGSARRIRDPRSINANLLWSQRRIREGCCPSSTTIFRPRESRPAARVDCPALQTSYGDHWRDPSTRTADFPCPDFLGQPRFFRQLARSRQFASVQFDYSDISLDLVEKLVVEGRERAANGGTLQSRSIGPCIRRITVATNPGWISHRHGVELRTINDLEETEQNKRMMDASTAFFGGYMARLQGLLPVLPHLELLDWEDMIALPPSFYDSIACSHIKHLKLFRVSVGDGFQLGQPNARGSGAWPLRTLHLELRPSLERLSDFSTLVLCASILRSCAPTLEALTWNAVHHYRNEPSIAAIEAVDTVPRFTAIRSLKIGDVGLATLSLLDSLVQDGLRELDVDTEASPVFADFFKQRGSIRSLTTFVWDSPKYLSFISSSS